MKENVELLHPQVSPRRAAGGRGAALAPVCRVGRAVVCAGGRWGILLETASHAASSVAARQAPRRREGALEEDKRRVSAGADTT